MGTRYGVGNVVLPGQIRIEEGEGRYTYYRHRPWSNSRLMGGCWQGWKENKTNWEKILNVDIRRRKPSWSNREIGN